MERNLATLQQLHQKWPRDIEHIGGILGGQFSVDRYDTDRIALTDLGEY